MDRRTELQRRVTIATDGVHNSPGTRGLIRDLWDRVSELEDGQLELEQDVADLEAEKKVIAVHLEDALEHHDDNPEAQGYYQI